MTCSQCGHSFQASFKCPTCSPVRTELVDDRKGFRLVSAEYKPRPKAGVIISRTPTTDEVLIFKLCLCCKGEIDQLRSVRAQLLTGYHPKRNFPLLREGRVCLSCIPTMMAHGSEYGYEAILPDRFNESYTRLRNGQLKKVNGITEHKTSVLPEHSTIGFGMADVDEAGFEIPFTSAESTVEDLRAEALAKARSKRAPK